MAMSSFRVAIVFRGMWWSGEVGNAVEREIIFEDHIFASIIRVESDNFFRKIIFHNGLVSFENFLNFKFFFEGVEPNVFCEVINKNNIIFETIL